MEQSMLEATRTVKSTEWADSLSPMEHSTRALSSKEISMATASIAGSMVSPTKVSGRMVRCTARANLPQKMATFTKANLSWTNAMAKEHTGGMTGAATVAHGLKVNNMARVHTPPKKVRVGREFGRTVRKSGGLIEDEKYLFSN